MTSLANSIQEEKYLHQRLSPKPGDNLYLHLSDLLIAFQDIKTDSTIKILDYGAGGSPYRSLFPNSDYCRADFLQAAGDHLDYTLDENSIVAESNDTFDLVFSTQVLEHVKNPDLYLSESYRLLKPGGTLVCTTHGTFYDHGCPYDFQRWTADGLRRDMQKAGFEVERVAKLTTGARAFFSILEFSNPYLFFRRSTLLGFIIASLRKLFFSYKAYIDRELDKRRFDERVVVDTENNHTIYIGLMGVGTKPQK